MFLQLIVLILHLFKLVPGFAIGLVVRGCVAAVAVVPRLVVVVAVAVDWKIGFCGSSFLAGGADKRLMINYKYFAVFCTVHHLIIESRQFFFLE